MPVQEIKIGILFSYDYEMMRNCLPLVYEEADQIVLALDHKRRTWNGNIFTVSDSFFTWISEFDIDKKIEIYEDDFYDAQISVKDNETRERNMLSKKMGFGGWHIQLDSDEYFVDFKGFTDCLKNLKTKKKISIQAPWISLFKKVDGGFLYIKGEKEYCPIATNNPEYTDYRLNTNNEILIIDSLIIHESWARNEKALLQKLTNWGHKNDFNVDSYFTFWKALDKNTAKYVRNLHPLNPKVWSRLAFVEGNDVDDIRPYFQKEFDEKSLFSTFNPDEEAPLFQIIKERFKRKFNLK